MPTIWKLRFVLAWLVCGILISAGPFLWHVDYFRNAGPFLLLAQALPCLLLAASLMHSRLRAGGLWRHEISILAGAALTVALLAEPRATLLILCIVAASLALGLLGARKLSLEISEAPIAILFGLGCFILVLAVFGRLGWFYPSTSAALLAVPLPLLIPFRRQALFLMLHPVRSWKVASELAAPEVGIATLFAALFTSCSLLVMLTPTMAFDVLFYHFPLAESYARIHQMQPDASILQSYYPQGVEILMSLAFSLGGRAAAQLITPLFFALFLWISLRTARDCGEDRAAAVLGVIAAGSLPFLHWTGSVPKNDIPMAAFQMASLYAFLQWTKGRGFAWVIAGVFFLGQSFGVKHVALFGAVPLALMFTYAICRQPRRWRAALLVLVVLACTGFFWHVSTYLLTGNPIFPEGVRKAVHGGLHEHTRTVVDVLKRYFTMPWHLIFQGQGAFESPTPNPVGIFLFLFAPLPFLVPRRWSTPRRAIALFVVLYLAYWSTVMSSLRYAIVPFTLLTITVAGAVMRFGFESLGWMRQALRCGVFAAFLFPLLVVLTFEVNSLQFAYLLKTINATAYLGLALPSTPVLFHLQGLDPHAAAFGVENCSRLYAPDPARFGCLLCARGDCSLTEIDQGLTQFHYDFLILPSRPDFDELRKGVIAGHRAVEVYRDSHFAAYRLRAAPR